MTQAHTAGTNSCLELASSETTRKKKVRGIVHIPVHLCILEVKVTISFCFDQIIAMVKKEIDA